MLSLKNLHMRMKFSLLHYRHWQGRKKKNETKTENTTRKCCCVKSLNGKVCLTVTAALPDLPRKCSGSVSVTPRNNKQVFHVRALLTICKAGIMKRSRLVPPRQAQRTDSHLQKEQHRKRKTRETGRAGTIKNIIKLWIYMAQTDLHRIMAHHTCTHTAVHVH